MISNSHRHSLHYAFGKQGVLTSGRIWNNFRYHYMMEMEEKRKPLVEGLKGIFPLLSALSEQRENARFRFHVPAHTVLPGEYWGRYDLTELPGLDQLYAPRGCIAAAQELAAPVFGAGRTYFLVNGSSAGLTAAVYTACRPGEKLLLGRNCHRSVAAGLILSGAEPCFLPVPETATGIPLNISVEAAAKALNMMPEPPRGLMVTSPNYYGISADLEALSALVRRAALPMMVDEAHGGHFFFHSRLPPAAACSGADLWINSAHKILGALTPGAYLHLREGALIDQRRLEHSLAMLQTSSPPYPVLLSLDLARGWLQERGAASLDEALERAGSLRRAINSLGAFSCLEEGDLPAGYSLDPLRLTICWDRIALNGFQLSVLLQQDYGIEVEMAGFRYLVALVHPGLPTGAAAAFSSALGEIVKNYRTTRKPIPYASYPLPRQVFTPRQGVESPSRLIPVREAAGLVSAQIVTPFPPGVPVLYPGEEISEELCERLAADLAAGVHFQDLRPEDGLLLAVVTE